MDGRRVDVFGFVCLFGFLCLVRYLGVVADGPVGNLNRALYAQLADIPVRDSGFVSYASRSMVALPPINRWRMRRWNFSGR